MRLTRAIATMLLVMVLNQGQVQGDLFKDIQRKFQCDWGLGLDEDTTWERMINSMLQLDGVNTLCKKIGAKPTLALLSICLILLVALCVGSIGYLVNHCYCARREGPGRGYAPAPTNRANTYL